MAGQTGTPVRGDTMSQQSMTRPIDRESPSRPEQAPADGPRTTLFDLSLTQLIGGALAAATTAAVGSRLGVLGTIAGAALGSFVSAVAASLYINSLTRARSALTAVRSMQGPSRLARRPPSRPLDRRNTRRLLATSGAVFAMAAAFLFGIQLASGTNVTGTDVGTRYAQGAALRPDFDGELPAQRTLGDDAPEVTSHAQPSSDMATDGPTPGTTATIATPDDSAPDTATGTTGSQSDTTATRPTEPVGGAPTAPVPAPATPAPAQPTAP